MKASELRIGNYLQGKRIVKVKSIYSTGDVSIFDNSSRFFVEGNEPCLNPIELTEEWLLNLGFEKIIGGGISFNKGELSIYLGGRTYFNSWGILQESPKYVHQLQNLYFALTGYELQKIEDESK